MNHAKALYNDDRATLDDVREAVTTLEETLPTARRVLGGAHPFTVEVERNLGDVRAALRRETLLEEFAEAMASTLASTTLGDA